MNRFGVKLGLRDCCIGLGSCYTGEHRKSTVQLASRMKAYLVIICP